MLVNVLNICSDDELMGSTDPAIESTAHPTVLITPEQIAELKRKEEKRITLQKKILAVAKMAKYFHTLREESETGRIDWLKLDIIFGFSFAVERTYAERYAPNRYTGWIQQRSAIERGPESNGPD